MIRTVLAGATIALLPGLAAAQQVPELSFGTALTSDYIFRGTTQSDGEPAVQGYAEAEIGGFYFGAWASTLKYDDDRVEVDLYAGFRGGIGNFEYDIGYVRYFYDETGDCCGEAYLGLDYALDGLGVIGGSLFYDPDTEGSWAEVRIGTELGASWAVDGAVGTDFGSLEPESDEKVAWNLGVTRALGDLAALDLRYHDSTSDPARLVATISLDF